MKRLLGLLLLAATPAVCQNLSPAALATRAKVQNVPEIPFESVPNFLKMPPNLYLGEGIGIATNSKGHIFVFTRSQRTRLFEFDQAGTFIRELGEGLYGFVFAHAVRVDPHDNIWAVDEGSNMVIKFNPEGRVIMTLGRRPEPVDALAPPIPVPDPANPGKYIFNRPTDVAWDPAGNIFVTDGYANSRIVKYDKQGRFVAQAGTKGSAPGQINLPHSLAVDAQGNAYVADRSNRRIQVFDNDLKFKAIYDNVGTPWELCISPGPHQYLYSSNTFPDNNDYTLATVTGEVYKMELDGAVLGKFGKAGKQLGEFSGLHEIDCRNPDVLYISEIQLWRVQKLMLHPAAK
ncbi:MAG TPA: peptidyl-alpha-hydroxyglycine alpha-amidating lyase family protein [Candidatus Sulfopaludibacter sp.]|jgi:DNA-binding beta-propeller fold protein YncE|nr:peptidyl-alpha-hydroxyglycine alpha-amidating lyase family protein [Candidatus Sulfopaludibacter sp.]